MNRVLTGSPTDLDSHIGAREVKLPRGKEWRNVVGVGITRGDNVYVWFDDQTMASGSALDLDSNISPRSFSLPTGQSVEDIVAMAIGGSNNRVYTWYADGTRSVGRSTDLDFYSGPSPVSLPSDKSMDDVIGIGIAGSNSRVHVWYSDGTMSIGRSNDFDRYQSPTSYTLPSQPAGTRITGMAMSGADDRVYTWLQQLGSGNSAPNLETALDNRIEELLRERNFAGATVSVSKDGRLVYEKAFGYADIEDQTRMTTGHTTRIGSMSKVLTGYGAMKLSEDDGFEGLLDTEIYQNYLVDGYRHFIEYDGSNSGNTAPDGIAATAISGNTNRVYTWYLDGTMSVGTTSNLERYQSRRTYSLPPGKTPFDLRAAGIGTEGRVYYWYDDGTVSSGGTRDLDSFHGLRTFAVAPGRRLHQLMAVAIAGSNNRVFAWYSDGTGSSGTTRNLGSHSSEFTYELAPGREPHQIRGMGMSGGDRVNVWYSDGTTSKGSAQELDRFRDPYNYTFTGQTLPDNPQLPVYEQVTLRHLLTHSSGFPADGSSRNAATMFGIAENDVTYAYAHRHTMYVRDLRSNDDLPQNYRYSSHGIGVVGHVMELLAEKDYESYMKDDIFDDQVDMYRAGTAPAHVSSTTHDLDNDERFIFPITMNESRLGLASAGWETTAGDIVRFLLWTDPLSLHNSDFLTEDSIDDMESRQFDGDVGGRAIAWAIHRDGSRGYRLRHGGAVAAGGGKSVMAKYVGRYREAGVDVGGINISICTNTNGAGAGELDDFSEALVLEVANTNIDASVDFY